MNEQAIRFRIGIFVLGALILMAVLILLFGGFPNYFKRSVSYRITFDNAPNLAAGTPVRRSGVKIGEVRSIKLDDETGKVDVEIAVDPQFTIRKKDEPFLALGLLGGDVSIDFLPKKEDARPDANQPMPPGSTIEGVTQADASTLVQRTSELMPGAQEAMLEMRRVFQRFDKMSPLFEETIREYRDLGKDTRAVIPELRKTNAEIQELARAAREIVPDLNKTNAEIQELARVARQTIPDLRKTNDEFQVTARNWSKLGERLDVLVQTNEDKIVKALDRMNDTLRRVGEVFNDENQKLFNDTLRNAKLGSDNLPSIAQNTDGLVKDGRVAIQRMNELLKQSEEIVVSLQKATKPLGERSEPILKNLEEGTDRLNRLLGDTRDLYQSVTKGDGSLQRFLNDPTLFTSLVDITCQVNRMLPRVDRIMRDVEIFADRIARHPEALGVGGAVRPSNGLKEAPSTLIPSWRPGH